ncbi:MAG TPA: type II toxin-antitoxin system HicB family antitoxin [Actinomycetes bacterium]|nr:type II toxin-antitoxin system HicB family antitoxin [Actinomycetes bacterium]
MTNHYTVMVHQAEDGTFWGQVKELPGCFATGDDLDELREAVVEAITMYLSDAEPAPPEQQARHRTADRDWKVEGRLTLTPA